MSRFWHLAGRRVPDSRTFGTGTLSGGPALPGLHALAEQVAAVLGYDPFPAVALAGAGPVRVRVAFTEIQPDPVRRSVFQTGGDGGGADPMFTLAAEGPTVVGTPAALQLGGTTLAGGGLPELGVDRGLDGPLEAEPPVAAPSAEHAEVWEWVRLAQAGDGEAFGRLYDRYVDTVFRYIYFRVNDRALAEDFTSETFLRALRRITSISYQGRDIGAWFVTIARNIVFDHSKSARNRLEVTTPELIEGGRGQEHAPSPERAMLDSFTATALMAAVKQLNAEQRECVTLRFIQGFSVSETAAAMGKNDGAIKALQHRAVKKLAEIVGDSLR